MTVPVETRPWDAAEVLDSPAAIAAYLDAYLEDGTPEELLGRVLRGSRDSVEQRSRRVDEDS